MFRESKFLEMILGLGRKIIPGPIFDFFRPWYHGILALSGAMIFGWPASKLKVIGVTGSKGKSTVVYLITKFLEEGGYKVAAIGSLGYKLGDKEWPNNLKMTMPGRWKIQKFLAQALKAGCQFAVLEVTSEGISQKRHWGIKFDCAVFTNLEKEHIESHGSFEKYYQAKQKLFKMTKNIHILNADSQYFDLFSKFKPRKKFFYSLKNYDHYNLKSRMIGDFNKSNILAAVETVKNYSVGLDTIQKALDKIKSIPGRLEFIQADQNFKIVVDYAHTPGSLEAVYKTLKEDGQNGRLICILGAAGGGRDKWKRPILGGVANQYCQRIILTNEDPYDEPPERIIEEVASGIENKAKLEIILDRGEAIKKALLMAKKNDTIIVTGKGSENSIAVKNNQKIPWSDKDFILSLLD